MPRFLPFLCYAALLVAGLAHAGQGKSPVLVELFTSQGCYSCPAADRYLGTLQKREGIIALEFHVTYWNDLVYGASGRWEDVFSKVEYTARQQAYARSHLKGRRGVYTPQMVIGGVYAAVGSSESEVDRRIRSLRESPPPLMLTTRLQGDELNVAVAGSSGGRAEIWLAVFDRYRRTDVTAGENKGKVMENYNVVTGLRRVGEWRDQPVEFVISDVTSDEKSSCAVFVQRENHGEILGAAAC